MKLYEGAADEKSEEGPTYDLVMHMLDGFNNRDHVLFMDNWFTSPAVIRALAERGILACGSVRLNRVGMPDKSLLNKSMLKKMKQWEVKHFSDEGMALVVWKDRNVVKILYNYIQPTAPTATLTRYSDEHEKVEVDV